MASTEDGVYTYTACTIHRMYHLPSVLNDNKGKGRVSLDRHAHQLSVDFDPKNGKIVFL